MSSREHKIYWIGVVAGWVSMFLAMLILYG